MRACREIVPSRFVSLYAESTLSPTSRRINGAFPSLPPVLVKPGGACVSRICVRNWTPSVLVVQTVLLPLHLLHNAVHCCVSSDISTLAAEQ